jgi:exocyst complex component 2
LSVTSEDVHPFIYEALLSLVLAHAQVSGCTPSLVPRVLNALVDQLAVDARKAFSEIRRLGLGGMLQVSDIV